MLVAFFVLSLQLFKIPTSDLGIFSAAALAFCFGYAFAPKALGESDKPVHHLVAAALGLVVAAALKGATLYRPVGDLLIVYPAMLSIPAFAWLVSECFTGWCLSIPDRHIAARRRTHRALADFGGNDWRLAVVSLWQFLGICAFMLFPSLTTTLALLIGAVVVSVAVGVKPLDLVRTAWRSLVVIFTYERPRSSSDAIYTFRSPFRDHRFRVVFAVIVVLSASMMAVHFTQWPTITAKPTTVYSFLFMFALALFEMLLASAGILAFVFLAIVAVAGPQMAHVYNEFAKDAVKAAERAEA